MKTPLKPFSLTHTPNFPGILHDLNFTLAVSTFQAGKVIFLSAVDRERIVQLPRTFDNAMGLAIDNDRIAIACKNEVIELRNHSQLSKGYPLNPDTYDSFFVPRVRYNTGPLDLHDMNYANGKLLAINTLFSCIAEINNNYSFTPVWQPPFISKLAPEDRCHLNSVAVEDGIVEYVTALGSTDTAQGWRENKLKGGILMHVPTNKIVVDGLSMPHSPRIYDGKVYYLNSAVGELCVYDPSGESNIVITKLGGFARGMVKVGDYLFIGISKLRHTSDVFSTLPIAKQSYAGIEVVYLPYNKVVGKLRYEESVDEIYDVKALPGLVRPGIQNIDKTSEQVAFVTNEFSFWGVAKKE